MSQVTGPLTVNNGADTPSAKQFAPIAVGPDLSIFAEKSAISSSGFVRIVAKTSLATNNRPTNRVDFEVELPVIEAVDGTNKVTRVGRFKGYFVIPDTMTAAERKDLHAYAVNGMSDTLLKALVRDLETLY